MSDQFDASASAAGYFFQARYALLLLLKSGPGSEVSIETLDDVTVNDSDGEKLVQLKHLIASSSNVTDYSSHLWKTINIWAIRLIEGSVTSTSSRLQLITTSTLNAGSIASLLKTNLQSSTRDEEKALAELDRVASDSTNAVLKSCFDTYKSLSQSQKKQLVGMIDVIDKSPNLVSILDSIKGEMSLVTRPQFLDHIIQRVEGWWFDKVAVHLVNDKSSIKFSLLLSFVNDVQEEYHSDNLPIHFADFEPPERPGEPDRLFIEQLKLISITSPRIKIAIGDYFRAFNQRTKWIEDGNLDFTQLTKYERTLKDEWERLYYEVLEDLGDSENSDDKVVAGKRVYNELQKRSDLNIRTRCTEAYVMRGTFHILSDQLEIGWHPEFKDRLRSILDSVSGGA